MNDVGDANCARNHAGTMERIGDVLLRIKH